MITRFHPSAIACFAPASIRFEGDLRCMYLDIKGYVTTSVGILIEPAPHALGLDWRIRDPYVMGDQATDRVASRSEILQEWTAVKSLQAYKNHKPQFWEKRAKLLLNEAGNTEIIHSRLQSHCTEALRRFSPLPEWPWRVQLSTLLISWAVGSAFRFPLWESHVRSGDWYAASTQSRISPRDNPGLNPRNIFVRALLAGAEEETPPTLEQIETAADALKITRKTKEERDWIAKAILAAEDSWKILGLTFPAGDG